MEQVDRHFRRQTEFYEAEFRMRCANGQYKWILGRGKALFDADDKPVRMAGSHTDITQRREAEAHIRERTEQLNAIFALSPDGFVSFDHARRVKYVSPAFQRMTGFEEVDMIGLDESAFAERLARACVPEAPFPGMAALRGDGKVGGTGVADDNAKGGRRIIELAAAGKRVLEVGLRQGQAESVSQILYFRDITHETEVDRLKSEFLSTAAHELRTPMASIYGFTELLLSQEFSAADQRDFLGTIHQQSTLMVSIINELLDLARIEARRGKDFKIERVDVRALIAETAKSFNRLDGRGGPIEPGGDRAFWVRADRKKLTQAINNVLSNAYKYSPSGGDVVLSLDESPAVSGAPGRVAIRVADCGIGMTPEQLARVCERFYRADSSGKIPGTGLGMSIVQEIVQLHGGEIELTSQIGVGTTVTIWIPSVSAAAQDV
jgi:signal transduction histidine kinase